VVTVTVWETEYDVETEAVLHSVEDTEDVMMPEKETETEPETDGELDSVPDKETVEHADDVERIVSVTLTDEVIETVE